MKVMLFDYGVGNLHSLEKALQRFGADVRVTDSWPDALSADALVLPGVGAFQEATKSLPEDVGPIREALGEGLPCLGICLGMQLLFEHSEEGNRPTESERSREAAQSGRGIGWIDGSVRRLRARVVPQMGWNDVEASDDPVLGEPMLAYYANSYVCAPVDPGVEVAWSRYEGDRFPAAVRKGKTWGVQFHPEKSSAPGLALIERFLAEVG